MKIAPGAAVIAVASLLSSLVPAPAVGAESYWFHETTGRAASFYLIGGNYTLYVYARRPFTYPSDPAVHSCSFLGNFQRVWPTHDTLRIGSPIPIATIVPFKLGPTPITLPPGLYALFLPPLTNCDWKFILLSTSDNPAGIAPVTMLKRVLHRQDLAELAAIGDTVEFCAQFRTNHDENVPVSGTAEFIHDGTVFLSGPVVAGHDATSAANYFFVDVTWNSEYAKYLGKNTVNFKVKIGSDEFTSASEFTLTK